MSNTYALNTKLVVSELGNSKVAIYSPSGTAPVRFSSSEWQELLALGTSSYAKAELVKIFDSFSHVKSSDEYLEWLLNESILVDLPNNPVDSINSVSQASPRPHHDSLFDDNDVDESGGRVLFVLRPHWPRSLKSFIFSILRLQIFLVVPMTTIVLLYLLYSLFSPTLISLTLNLGRTEPTGVQVLERIIIGLLVVNVISTFFSWLSQSVFGLGDGKIILRFIFGFIPRLGVNSISPRSSYDSPIEFERDLICVSQPLLSRLSISCLIILLVSTSRLQYSGDTSTLYVYSLATLQLALGTGLILTLPYRQTPGYKLLVLLTDMPPNALGKSYRALFITYKRLSALAKERNIQAWRQFLYSITTKHDLLRIIFALFSVSVLLFHFSAVFFFAIPELAQSTEGLFGKSGEAIAYISLLALFATYLNKKFIKKLSQKSRDTSTTLSSSFQSSSDSIQTRAGYRTLHFNLHNISLLILLFALLFIFFFPIQRTVTGSVMVSTERDLTIRAPSDVRIVSVFERGPSTKSLSKGTHLLRLQSNDMSQDAYELELSLQQQRSDLDVLEDKISLYKSDLLKAENVIEISKKSQSVLTQQLKVLSKLSSQGAYSQKLVQDVLMQIYNLEADQVQHQQSASTIENQIAESYLKASTLRSLISKTEALIENLISEKRLLDVNMPFEGLITSSTSGLKGSFVPKGDSLLVVQQGSPHYVDVLIPDHDRSLVKSGQRAEIRLYSEQNVTRHGILSSIGTSTSIVDDKAFFKVSIRLSHSLDPQLLQSSGVTRINTGTTNLISLFINSISRFVLVDLWSWMP